MMKLVKHTSNFYNINLRQYGKNALSKGIKNITKKEDTEAFFNHMAQTLYKYSQKLKKKILN